MIKLASSQEKAIYKFISQWGDQEVFFVNMTGSKNECLHFVCPTTNAWIFFSSFLEPVMIQIKIFGAHHGNGKPHTSKPDLCLFVIPKTSNSSTSLSGWSSSHVHISRRKPWPCKTFTISSQNSFTIIESNCTLSQMGLMGVWIAIFGLNRTRFIRFVRDKSIVLYRIVLTKLQAELK